jgi:sorting nexin-1/2
MLIPSVDGSSWPSVLGSSTSAAPSQPATQDTLAPPRSPVRRGPRTPRKVSAQATKLEAVDDSTDPLGPLGDKSFTEEAPTPPQKEPFAARNARPTSSTSQASSGAGLMDSVSLEDDPSRIKGPPPVQPPPSAEGPKRQTQPSISVEQAAKPTFQITVGDPHKVGDLTSSHIVYQVRTKVRSLVLVRREVDD